MDAASAGSEAAQFPPKNPANDPMCRARQSILPVAGRDTASGGQPGLDTTKQWPFRNSHPSALNQLPPSFLTQSPAACQPREQYRFAHERFQSGIHLRNDGVIGQFEDNDARVICGG